MNTPTSNPDVSHYGGGTFHPHLFPLMPTHTQTWSNPGMYGQQSFNVPKNDRVVKRLSFSSQPVSHPLQNIVAKKRWSACTIPVHEIPLKTWNCAVFMDMGSDDEKSSASSSSSSSNSNSDDEDDDEYDEEEMKELELKKLKKERAKSLRECVVQEFTDNRFPRSQDTLSTLDSRSDRGHMPPSPTMKYDVLAEIRKKEALLQKEKDSDRANFLKNLILKRNEGLCEELLLMKDPRKAGDRRTSLPIGLLRREENPWGENAEVAKSLKHLY